MSQKGDSTRPDPYIRKANSEPSNCTLVNTVQADDNPYKKAKEYIELNPASNCCTVEGKNVKQWELPEGAGVQLVRKNGPTFYYDATQLTLD